MQPSVAVGATAAVVTGLLHRREDRGLHELAKRVAGLLDGQETATFGRSWIENEIEELRPSSMSVEIREHAGRLVTEAGPALDLSVSETGCQSRSDVRVCAIGAGPFMVVVGASEADDRATRDSLSRVIANLLDNAAKHGAGAIVAVRAELDGAVVRISVVNGAREGELTERAFEPFFRGPRASGLPGFGLGLPFARAVARAHGGEPSIGSPSIEHTELVLSLPAVAWSDGLGAS